jgi:hypothetical protein
VVSAPLELAALPYDTVSSEACFVKRSGARRLCSRGRPGRIPTNHYALQPNRHQWKMHDKESQLCSIFLVRCLMSRGLQLQMPDSKQAVKTFMYAHCLFHLYSKYFACGEKMARFTVWIVDEGKKVGRKIT